MISNAVWIYTKHVCTCSLANANDQAWIIFLMQNMYSAMNPTCMQIVLIIYIYTICVHKHSFICNNRMIIHSISSINKYKYSCICNMKCDRVELISNVNSRIHEQPLATICNHINHNMFQIHVYIHRVLPRIPWNRVEKINKANSLRGL